MADVLTVEETLCMAQKSLEEFLESAEITSTEELVEWYKALPDVTDAWIDPETNTLILALVVPLEYITVNFTMED